MFPTIVASVMPFSVLSGGEHFYLVVRAVEHRPHQHVEAYVGADVAFAVFVLTACTVPSRTPHSAICTCRFAFEAYLFIVVFLKEGVDLLKHHAGQLSEVKSLSPDLYGTPKPPPKSMNSRPGKCTAAISRSDSAAST
jgi:hypothetical protein